MKDMPLSSVIADLDFTSDKFSQIEESIIYQINR